MNGFLKLIPVIFILTVFLVGCDKLEPEKSSIANYTPGIVLERAKETKQITNFDLLKIDIQSTGEKVMLNEIADNKTLNWLKETKNITNGQVCFTDADCSKDLKCVGQCRVMDNSGEHYLESWACRLDDWTNHTDIVPVLDMGLCLGGNKWPY